MKKQEMVQALSERTRLKQQDCLRMLNTFMDLLGEELGRGGRVGFQGFGTFCEWKQSGRPGRNPRTGESALIRPRTSVKFKPGLDLLARLNGK